MKEVFVAPTATPADWWFNIVLVGLIVAGLFA